MLLLILIIIIIIIIFFFSKEEIQGVSSASDFNFFLLCVCWLKQWKWESSIMRTLCDACESAAAIVFCAADEAALCRACDEKVASIDIVSS